MLLESISKIYSAHGFARDTSLLCGELLLPGKTTGAFSIPPVVDRAAPAALVSLEHLEQHLKPPQRG